MLLKNRKDSQWGPGMKMQNIDELILILTIISQVFQWNGLFLNMSSGYPDSCRSSHLLLIPGHEV